MHADATHPERVALQPESRAEERALDRLFSRLQCCRFQRLTTFYTFDVTDYDHLDTDLARRAADADPFGPGSRALVVEAPEGGRA
jgi:hypothetical protein